MEFIDNLQRRTAGLGFRKNLDICIPRLANHKSDICKRTPPEPEDDPDSECLVGRFCPFDKRFGLYAVADEIGYVYFDTVFDTTELGSPCHSSLKLHDNAIFDLAWMKTRSGERCMVTASGDKTVKILNLSIPVQDSIILSEHQQSLRALCTHPDYPGFLASSGRDGNIVIYDDRRPDHEVANIIVGAHILPNKSKATATVKANNKSVTALVLKDATTLISGGFTDGTVKVWDLRRTYLKNAAKQPQPLHTFNVGATVTSLNVKDSLLYASCTNHSIFCFNASTFEEKPVRKFVGHDTNSAYSSYMHASVSACGHYLASGSFDGSIYIWSTKLGRSRTEMEDDIVNVFPVARLVGHEKEVTCVQFGYINNQLMLLSLSDDNTHRIWRTMPRLDRPDVDDPMEGQAEIMYPQFFQPPRNKSYSLSSGPSKDLPRSPLKPFPSFVHQPDSVIHHCSPRLPKCSTNWLTALSPQNGPQVSPASKPKVKRSVRSDKKSSKKLKLSSPIKTYIKFQPK